MLKITADEVNYIVHQYLLESGKLRLTVTGLGFKHSAFNFENEARMADNKCNDY